MIGKALYRMPKVSHRALLGRCRRPFSAFVVDDRVVANADTRIESSHQRMPVTQFSEDEQMARDAARIWANEVLKPIVRDMDDECKTRPEVITSLFDHGFMGMVRCNIVFSFLRIGSRERIKLHITLPCFAYASESTNTHRRYQMNAVALE